MWRKEERERNALLNLLIGTVWRMEGLRGNFPDCVFFLEKHERTSETLFYNVQKKALG